MNTREAQIGRDVRWSRWFLSTMNPKRVDDLCFPSHDLVDSRERSVNQQLIPLDTHFQQGRHVFKLEQKHRLSIVVPIFRSTWAIQWTCCQATCQHDISADIAEPKREQMIIGDVNVLLAQHPKAAPDLHDTNEGNQMEEIGYRAVEGFAASFEKTFENGNLNQAEEKEEKVANEERDCHRPDFVLGIDVEIG